MFCRSCGRELADDVKFCPACGVPVVDTESAAEQVKAPEAPVHIPAEDNPGAADEQDESKPRKQGLPRAAIVAIVIAVTAALAGGGAFLWWRAEQDRIAQEAYDAAHSLHAVTISVSASGWDTANGASRLPVSVKGTDLDGNEVDDTAFVDSAGTGISLMQGTYRIEPIASPFGSNCELYAIPEGAGIDIEISDDVETEAPVDATEAGAIALEPLEVSAITDEQLQAAYDQASAGGYDDPDAATKARDGVVAAREEAVRAEEERKAAEEAARQAEAARTFDCEYFSFKVPESWVGNYTVEEIDDSTTGTVIYDVLLGQASMFMVTIGDSTDGLPNDPTLEGGVTSLGTTSGGLGISAIRGNNIDAADNMADIAECMSTFTAK